MRSLANQSLGGHRLDRMPFSMWRKASISAQFSEIVADRSAFVHAFDRLRCVRNCADTQRGARLAGRGEVWGSRSEEFSVSSSIAPIGVFDSGLGGLSVLRALRTPHAVRVVRLPGRFRLLSLRRQGRCDDRGACASAGRRTVRPWVQSGGHRLQHRLCGRHRIVAASDARNRSSVWNRRSSRRLDARKPERLRCWQRLAPHAAKSCGISSKPMDRELRSKRFRRLDWST